LTYHQKKKLQFGRANWQPYWLNLIMQINWVQKCEPPKKPIFILMSLKLSQKKKGHECTNYQVQELKVKGTTFVDWQTKRFNV